MTFVELYSEILIRLGGNLVDIELSTEDVAIAFKSAIRTFKQKAHNTYRRKWMAIDVSKGIDTYTIPDNITDGVKVIRPGALSGFAGTQDVFTQNAIIDMLPTAVNQSCTGIAMLEYTLLASRMKEMSLYTATDVDFQIDKFRHEITFFNTPQQNETWFVEVYEDLTDDEYSDIDWIVRWTLAESKIILGNAYRKFGGSIPGPSGVISLPGSELIQEGTQDKTDLLQEIEEMTDGNIDYWGVYFG
ncbi:MAG: hypothetical protein JHC38_02810 [Thiotrichales bacterium]|jgi:hypothetical protein|nr:hypothetical protein [Thiotrichales bacterium]